MVLSLRPMVVDEQKYAFTQSHQLNMQCGSTGHLRGDFDGRDSFFTTWWDHSTPYKTDAFKAELENVVRVLRSDSEQNGLLKDLDTMTRFCHHYTESRLLDRYSCYQYGFRINTTEYAFLVRCNPQKGDYNFYIYPYVEKWLDRHIEHARHGIRFITSGYKELFRIQDGGLININRPDGSKSMHVCRYIDDTHTEVGDNLFHICEFAERMEDAGNTYGPTSEGDKLPAADAP